MFKFKCKFCADKFKTRAARATHTSFRHPADLPHPKPGSIDPETVRKHRDAGVSWRQIATLLGVSPGGVRQAYKKAATVNVLNEAVSSTVSALKKLSHVTLSHRGELLQIQSHLQDQRTTLTAQIGAIDVALKSFPQ
jgi:hypothetical protein